jgi:hypothetical protein
MTITGGSGSLLATLAPARGRPIPRHYARRNARGSSTRATIAATATNTDHLGDRGAQETRHADA